MTVVQAMEALLKSEWQETIWNRSTDVPQPTFNLEKENIQSSLRTNDVCQISDGGDFDIEPRGIGWTHEGTTARVSIDFRTANRREDGVKTSGRHRLFGERNGIEPADRYSGLVGEAKRVLDSNRKGFAEFDLVVPGPLRDISEQTGQNHYRAVIDVALIQVAESITPGAAGGFGNAFGTNFGH